MISRRQLLQRHACLSLLALPAACSIVPLPGLRRSALPASTPMPAVRPPAAGQTWSYRVLNAYNSEVRDLVQETVATIGPQITIERQSPRLGALPAETQAPWGQVQQDPSWDMVQTYDMPLPLWLQPLAVGTTWAADTHYHAGTSSFRNWISVQMRVAAIEQVQLASGTFNTYRIEKFIRLTHYDSSRSQCTRTDTLWLAPEVGRWVARETNGEYWRQGRRPTQYREDHLRWELESWT